MMKKFLIIIILFTIHNSFAYQPIATDARIKTLIYSPTEIFKLKFHDNYQSYIEFPKNEKFKIISLGDHYGWDIKQIGQRLFIRPKQQGLFTNMTIITNQRPYHFEILSSSKPLDVVDADLVYVAKFYYPDNSYDFMQTVKLKKPLSEYKSRLVNKSSVVANPEVRKKTSIPLRQENKENLVQGSGKLGFNYAYSMVGKDSNISPVKIYDDGISTYFKFSNNVLPDIFYVNKDGSETPAKYIVKDGMLVVKNTAWQFSLRNNNNLICIFNNGKLSY